MHWDFPEISLLGLGFGRKSGWEMGFGQNLGWKMGFIPPLSGPSIQIHMRKLGTVKHPTEGLDLNASAPFLTLACS